MLLKDEGICIRTVDYSETSQVLTFFTRENGKTGLIAKGSKRAKSAFGGPIEVFSYGKIVFSPAREEGLGTLTEFDCDYGAIAASGLSRSLFGLNCCLLAAELLNNLTNEGDSHPVLFEAFFDFLRDAAASCAQGQRRELLALLIVFELRLLGEAGLRPVLNACSNCRRPYGTGWKECYFSSSANGLICRDCEGSFPDRMTIPRRFGAVLSQIKLLAEADEKTLLGIEKLFLSHFTYHLHRPPKMAKYVTGV